MHGKSKDFLYSGTGLRNTENNSTPLMMYDGKIHMLSPPSSSKHCLLILALSSRHSYSKRYLTLTFVPWVTREQRSTDPLFCLMRTLETLSFW